MANLVERLLLAAVVTELAGCGLPGPAHDEPLPTVAAVVDMGFTSFAPDIVRIHAGQTVEWRNTAFITHTVTSDVSGSERPLDSGDLLAGNVYLHTFMVPGTYKYFCRHHEDDGMVATVVVDP